MGGSQVDNFDNNIVDNLSATILSGQDTSGDVQLKGTTIAGFTTPSTLTTANITFLVSIDEVNFVALQDGSGAVINKVVSTDIYVPLNPADFFGIRTLRFVAADGNEGQNSTFQVVPYSI